MVEAGHLLELAGDAVLEVAHRGGAALVVGGQVAVATGIEARLEEADQQAGDGHVAQQRVLDRVLREGGAALAHVLRVRAQHHDLAPGQAGGQHQGVEPVALVAALPHRVHGVLEQLARTAGQGLGVPHAEVVDVGPARQPLELVGPLVDDLHAHGREHRQHLAQRQWGADAEDLEPGLTRRGVDPLVEGQRESLVGLDRLQPAEVDRTGPR